MRRGMIPLVVGLLIGGFAIKVFVNVLKRAQAGNVKETVQVVCATTDIAPTMEIQDSMVQLTEVPKALVPKLAFEKKEEVIGRVTTMSIAGGTPVVPGLLAPPGTPPGMAVRIPDGYRAVAVQIDEFVGVAGWIKPGSRVDVVAVMEQKDLRARVQTISKVVLQDVEVLAVGQDIGATGDTAAAVTRSVTLLVKPADARRLHLAETKGKLRLAMRNQHDHDVPESAVTTYNDLLAEGEDKKPGGFLGRLFGKEPQIDPQATDKEAKAVVAPAEPAVPPPKAEWVVEVVSPSEKKSYEVRFENGSRNAKLVCRSGPGGESRTAVLSPPRLEAFGGSRQAGSLPAARE